MSTSTLSASNSLALARGTNGCPMTDPNGEAKAKAARKRARSVAKETRKRVEVKRREEVEKARLARAARKEQKRLARKVRETNLTLQEVKPPTTPVVTQRHIEELRRRDWVRERPSRAHTQSWVEEITPQEEVEEVETLGDFMDPASHISPIRWGEFESTAIQMAKSAQALERKLQMQAKWLRKSFAWQHMFVFLKAKYGVDLTDLTLEEWESKQLSPERVKSLGVRSPKLSKALAALGVPQQEVGVLLGANYNDKNVDLVSNVTKVLSDQPSCFEQGNSIYYSSCQATDSRAQWGGGDSYNRIKDEAHLMGSQLFLWVVGEPMSKNGRGFEARAKLRVMYADRACKEVAGLYIDRPYGKHQQLLDNLGELQTWWSSWCEAKGLSSRPILMPPVWNRDNGAGNDFQYMYGGRYPKRLYCPSARAGYQDTLNQGLGGYDCFVDVSAKGKTLLAKAYTKRSKFGGVYMSPLTDVVYNPQKGDFSVPIVRLPVARKAISQKYREIYAECRKMFGASNFEEVGSTYYFTWSGIRVEVILNHSPEFTSNTSGFYVGGLRVASTHERIVEVNCWTLATTVQATIPELGFGKACELPYTYEPYLKVWRDSEEHGFWKATDLKKGQLVHTFAQRAGVVGDVDGRGLLKADNGYLFAAGGAFADGLMVAKEGSAWSAFSIANKKDEVYFFSYPELGYFEAVNLTTAAFAMELLKGSDGFDYTLSQHGSYALLEKDGKDLYRVYHSKGLFGFCYGERGPVLVQKENGLLSVQMDHIDLGFAKSKPLSPLTLTTNVVSFRGYDTKEVKRLQSLGWAEAVKIK